MGFFKKLKEGFDSAREQMRQNIEEAKQQAMQTIEETKQQAMQTIEETKQQAMQNIKEAQQRIMGQQQTTKNKTQKAFEVIDDSHEAEQGGTKCPYCATPISKETDKCPMCGYSLSTPEPALQAAQQEDPTASDGMFSARLEALISSALQDGVLTDQEKAVLKKRAEAEGEDWDEVEMILNTRLAEIQAAKGIATGSVPSDAPTKKAEDKPSLSQTKETNISSTPETLKEASKETDGTGLIVYENGETEVLSANCTKIADEGYDYSNIVKLVLPSGIKRIGERAFYRSLGLEEVDFSRCSKLETIGDSAFAECKSLKVVDLSECTRLKVIDDHAFDNCKKLGSIVISQCKKLERIGRQAFGLDDGNNLLETVTFPASLKNIEDHAFCGCNKLKEVDFSQCMLLETIGEGVFNCSQLKQVVFPASLKKIGAAFYKCDKLEVLDFSACTQLEFVSIDLVKGLNNIKVLDFSNCVNLNLSPLDIPESFENIILPPGQKTFNAMCIWDQFGYNIDKSHCHFQQIRKEAFKGMGNLTELDIPDSVEEIGMKAFVNCNQLKTLIMPASLKKMESLGWGLERLKKIDFSKVTQLKKIPETLSEECPKLRELIIPNGVIEIEDDAFSGMRNLRTLFLPPTLEEMGELGLKKLDIYCFSPTIEELNPLVVSIFDDEEDEDEEEEENKSRVDPKSYRINLFVLPQYLESYIAQRKAERIQEDVLIIQEIPEDFRYYYDN